MTDRQPNGVEPFRLHFDRHEKVVEVHDGVYASVYRTKENRGRGLLLKGHPAEEKNGYVMVPMQKDERLLMNDDEKGVEQLSVGRNQCVLIKNMAQKSTT